MAPYTFCLALSITQLAVFVALHTLLEYGLQFFALVMGKLCVLRNNHLWFWTRILWPRYRNVFLTMMGAEVFCCCCFLAAGTLKLSDVAMRQALMRLTTLEELNLNGTVSLTDETLREVC